jgi:probable rRNA maturation factor
MSTTRRSASSLEGATERRNDAATDEPSIEVINRQRLRAIDKKEVAQLAQAVLQRIGRAEQTVTITFIRDRAMQKLNRDYRGLDKPTDVLSFAYHEESGFAHAEADALHLGDVVIAVETAERYARELGLTYDRELEHLIIHGTLHLAGYDHETDNGEMQRLERKLRRALLR